MKKYLIILTLISSIASYSQKITRGPDIGELYFIGPSNTGIALYRSTDFGQNLNCMDSIAASNMISIEADKTPGSIYFVNIQNTLFLSNNYGNEGSWNLVNSNISTDIISGRMEGEIYSSFSKHSSDFGSSFIQHTANGYFGNNRCANIDNQNINIGYVLVDELFIFDSLYLLFTNDNFENLELINTFNIIQNEIIRIECGIQEGEVFIFNKNNGELLFSNNYGFDFELFDYLNLKDSYSIGFIGGNQIAEVFVLYNFINLMWQNAHTYIFHSTDYGNTFEVFHPFSKGNEPVLANFSAIEKEVLLTTPVEFSNFSIGSIIEYQWDFENDGIIDSYNEYPTHIYQDTGYYSVRLSAVGQDSTNTFIKENYIHVIDTLTSSPESNQQEINIFPNPFIDKISIELRQDFEMIKILNLNGKCHFSKTLLHEHKTEIIELEKLEKGIYILEIRTDKQNITKKIIKI